MDREPDSGIREAVRLLRQGGLIAFPTETYYGLGVDPFNVEALQRLFAVKQRPPDKAVLVLTPGQSQLHLLAAEAPIIFTQLMAAFWPGPLTLVFPALSDLPELLTGGTGTVGIRQTPQPLAARLLHEFAAPITATSANRSGAAPATTAAEVREIFGKEIDFVLDGGTSPGGVGSTLVGCDQEWELCCLRAGRIAFADVLKAVSAVG